MSNHNRYTATKEEAQRIHAILQDQVPIELHAMKDEILAFLEACTGRLPSRRAVENDRVRRLRKKHGSIGEDNTSA